MLLASIEKTSKSDERHPLFTGITLRQKGWPAAMKAGAVERGWLIEREGAAHKWWTGRGGTFTNDSEEGLRLARQRDAETIVQTLTCLSGCVATEHTWASGA